MDSHDRRHQLLAAFLTGELNPADAPQWDDHLLECEQCWRAVREDRAGRQAAHVLCQPAPYGLADRVAFAVELAAAADTAQRHTRHGMRLRWRWLASAGALACAVAVTVAVLLPGRLHDAASRWCCGCGGWAAWKRWSQSPPSRSPCPPAPTASPAQAWHGPPGWGTSACTAATATPPSWWPHRSRRRNLPRWRRGCRPEPDAQAASTPRPVPPAIDWQRHSCGRPADLRTAIKRTLRPSLPTSMPWASAGGTPMTASNAVGILAASAAAGPRRPGAAIRSVQPVGHAGQWLPTFRAPGS